MAPMASCSACLAGYALPISATGVHDSPKPSPPLGLVTSGRGSRPTPNLLAALGLACCAGFFIWGAILAAGGVSSQIPHNVARGKHQMFVSALCALGVGIGALVVNTFYGAGKGA